MKNRLIAVALGAAFIFGAGTWFGHAVWQPNVDPQIYYETHFTPQENGTKIYTDWLDKHARKSLKVAVYTFTNEAVADKYVELKTKYGSDVHVLLDLNQSRAVKWEPRLIDELRRAGIEVVTGTSTTKHAIMHDKFSIGNGAWVEDGSWNYTFTADKQANTIRLNIVPSPPGAQLYENNWDEMHAFMQQQQERR